MRARALIAGLVLTGGCSWLYEVPENRIPVKTRSTEARTRTNEYTAGSNDIDPTRPRDGADVTPDGAAATQDSNDGWNPVSVPVIPKEEPFEFKAANGTKIYNGPVGARSEGAARRGMTDAQYEAFQREGGKGPGDVE